MRKTFKTCFWMFFLCYTFFGDYMVKFLSGKEIVFPPTNEFLCSLTINELVELYKMGSVCGNLDQNSFFDVKSKTGLYERKYAVTNYYFAKHYLELDKGLLLAKKFRKNLSEEYGLFGRNLSRAYEYVGKRHDEFVEIGGQDVSEFRQYLLMNRQERKKAVVHRYDSLYDEYLKYFEDFSKESFIDLDSDDMLFERDALNTIDKNANLFLTYLDRFQEEAICSDALDKIKKVFQTERVDKKQLVCYFLAVYFKNRCLANVGFEINPKDYLQIMQFVRV